MSVTQYNRARADQAGPNPGPPGEEANADPNPDYCENAREYVLRRLDPTDPKSPSELADEYGCSNIHMQKTLADLADSGTIDRVSRGNYVADNVDDALEAGKDALSGAADTAADALDQLGDGDGSDGDADTPAAALPMEPKKLAAIIAVAVGLWLLLRAGNSDTADAAADTDAADVEDDQDALSGGLTG